MPLLPGLDQELEKKIALLYASEGAKVVVSDINEKAGQETAYEIESKGGASLFVKADTSIPIDHQVLVEQTIKQFGALHIVCNNAGIGGPLASTGEYPIEAWDKVLSVNLSGVFYGLHYQIPAILNSSGGSIVNIASILGMVGTKGSPAYVAAKHGVLGLTKAAALEYADKKIRINSIGPGYIVTPLLTNIIDETGLKALASLHPMGRLGEPEEIAELVLWLSSSKASFVTGSYYTIDGGYTAQ